ncbi:MAG: glycosyltransferase [Bacteroidales bacterium]|jgi:glycosyltransferase involved in cell wall biosynthesis|nr:glycosyltransferase [Bacteroidales bacterium]
MKILFLLSRFPYPLTKGDKLRAFNQMKYLAEENDIYLFCLNQTSFRKHKTAFPDNQTALKFSFLKGLKICNFNLWDACFGMFKSILNRTPLQAGFYTHNRHIRIFERHINEIKPDLIYVQFVRMAEYCRNVKVKKALDFQDALSANMLRRSKISNPCLKIILRREAELLRDYEVKMLDFFDLTTIITAADRREIASEARDKIIISGNGIDNSYFQQTETEDKKYDVVFCGNMSYAPNVDAAKYLIKSVMPLVWARYPQVKVLIAGANPKTCVRRLASERVEVSGYVEDMKQCYAQSKIFVAALRTGSGLQNKLLEAMAIGTPVICSSLANNALEATDGKHLLVANGTSQYANLILKLLTDHSLQQLLTSNALNFVKLNYNWRKICQNLTKEFQNLIKK